MSNSKGQIVVVSGKMGSGKTTLTKLLLNMPLKIRNEIRFASTIYKIHDEIRRIMDEFGIDTPEAVKVKDGALLQFLGTDWGRKTYGEDVWVHATRNQVEQLFEKVGAHAENILVVISDCRFKNEFEAFPEALRIRLECPKVIRQQRCEQWRENDTHQSEVDLDDYVHAGRFDLIFDTQFSGPEHIAGVIRTTLERGDWIAKRLTEGK